MLFPFIVGLILLSRFGAGAPEPKFSIPPLLPSPTGPLGAVISILGNIGNAEPPPLIYTRHPSPQCAKSNGGNGGQLQCCRAAVAGDLPIVVFLAGVYGYNLNPNDVNGAVCDGNINDCPGVRLCCEVTALTITLISKERQRV
ncbi:hypothetical protein F4802DRAFT_601768 [Xylaria palmicola]|nr:hypothetical protein F4802DRAFT_601768 [Xylaria palmicola]